MIVNNRKTPKPQKTQSPVPKVRTSETIPQRLKIQSLCAKLQKPSPTYPKNNALSQRLKKGAFCSVVGACSNPLFFLLSFFKKHTVGHNFYKESITEDKKKKPNPYVNFGVLFCA
jgi:hypothetical protein